MIVTARLAETLAYEILGTEWEEACLGKSLNPSSASADDLLGRFHSDLWDADGSRVLPLDEELIENLEARTSPYQDARAFVTEVTEVARLTRSERRVVYAIVDGAPIPDGKRYTNILALRLNLTPESARKTWSRAKAKLRETWVAE